MKKLTASNYQKDELYPAVARAVTEILKTETVITPVDVLVRMQRLTKQQVEDWRFGRIPYLERVVLGNLSKMNRILRILDHHARSRGLTPSQTVYRKWGKGGKRIILRFSKSGDQNMEAAYSRHYTANNETAGKSASRTGDLCLKGVLHGQGNQSENACVDQTAQRDGSAGGVG